MDNNWKSKEIGKQTLFWNPVTHEQLLYDPDNTEGALSILYKGINYKGCWSSRPGIVRKSADPSFVGRNEFVDSDGNVKEFEK